jgi:hypothetical protein
MAAVHPEPWLRTMITTTTINNNKCLLLGTDWVFKYNGLSFALKWLNRVY